MIFMISRFPIKIRSHRKIIPSDEKICANDREKESLDKLSFITREKRTRSKNETQKICLISRRLQEKGYFAFMFINIPLSVPLSVQHVVMMRSRFFLTNRKK